MESEKVKEIKKWLEDKITRPIDFTRPYENTLTLINELESEKDKYKNLYETIYRKYAKLEAETYTKEDVKEFKDRIAELEKENAIKTDTIVDLLKKQEFYEKEKLTKFAERLKEKFVRQEERFSTDVTRFENDLDKVKENDLPTAKYLIGKATGQATMAEKAQYYIDETLKEFL